jgi:hypothetical protein
MKNTLFVLMLIGLSGCSFGTPTGQIAVRVVDESGADLEGSQIQVFFESEVGKKTVKRGVSITNKLFFAEAPIVRPYVTVEVTKDGYYKSAWTYMFRSRDAKLNRYEPWGEIRTLELRKKMDVQEMQYKFVDLKTIPEFEKPIGFDLLIGDWVKPYGKGAVNDLIFQADKEGKWVSEYTVSFSNAGDGILEYKMPKKITSAYKWPYNAPLDGYQEVLRKITSNHQNANELSEHLVKKKFDTNYMFRIRTKLDEQGNVLSALYGKIRGELKVYAKGGVQFHYYLNTDPHSQSLESMHSAYP